ncbi:hypothetical protein FOZ63_002615 [Perkinsus olseni]|uniref:Prolipoprotein diacylglyceryl transferase n=1 Tax=Perkinsus olseni TaxID=32597 RepID=A0A7J6ULR0_PEROL|nr:hypothetical protein FOZ63_002615 [Perkinsus olseni]
MLVVVEFARPNLFTVFGQPVYGYGLCMALAFMLALLLGDGELRRKALKIDSSALLLSAMIGGILGSRLHYMLTWNSSSAVSFWDMSTGHSFQGGLLGGIVGTTGYTKLYCKESIGRMLDTLAPLLLIGHAIGNMRYGWFGYGAFVPYLSEAGFRGSLKPADIVLVEMGYPLWVLLLPFVTSRFTVLVSLVSILGNATDTLESEVPI